MMLVILGGAAAVGSSGPITGVEADLIFAAVKVVGVIAAKLVGWY